MSDAWRWFHPGWIRTLSGFVTQPVVILDGMLLVKGEALLYRITVQGHVGPRIEPVFPDLTVEDRDDLSIISGPIKDQAQLHGVLALIRDLNVPLIAVEQL